MTIWRKENQVPSEFCDEIVSQFRRVTYSILWVPWACLDWCYDTRVSGFWGFLVSQMSLIEWRLLRGVCDNRLRCQRMLYPCFIRFSVRIVAIWFCFEYWLECATPVVDQFESKLGLNLETVEGGRLCWWRDLCCLVSLPSTNLIVCSCFGGKCVV